MESNPAPPAAPVLGLILAGGRATRMGGGDKPLLALGGRPMLAHVIDRLAPQVAALAMSVNGDPARFAAFGLPALADEAPDRPGPLAGMLAGLDHAAARGLPLVAVAPGDTPFLPRDLVARLAGALGGALGGAPLACAVAGGRAHPACALIRVELRAPLRAALAAGVRRVGDWMRDMGAAEAEFPDPEAFFNVNRPADLALAEARLAGP